MGGLLNHIVEFLLNYWLHSSFFLGLILVAFHLGWLTQDRRGEICARFALNAGFVSALLFVSDFRVFPDLTNQFSYNLSNSGKIERRNDQPSLTLTAIKENGDNESTSAQGAMPRASHTSGKQSVLAEKKDEPRALSSIKNKSRELDSNFNLVNLTVFFWMFVIGVMFLQRIRQYLLLTRQLSNRKLVCDKRVISIFNGIKKKEHSSVLLTQSSKIKSPIVLSQHEIVIPDNLSSHLALSQIKAALAHELAHVTRKDNLWLKFYLFFQTVFFFQPLNNLLIKRLYQVAEVQSDKLASKWTNDPNSLAEALAINAEQQIKSSQTINSKNLEWVSAMQSNKGNLLNRVERLLGQNKRSSSLLSIFSVGLLAFSLLFALPGFSIGSAKAESKVAILDSKKNQVRKMSSVHDDGDIKVTLEAELKGDIKFNNEETEILSFPEDSEFDIRFEENDETTRLVILRDGKEAIEYKFYIDGDKAPFDAKAKRWFASKLPEIFRMTGINAEERVARIKAKSGESGVLDEIELIKSDFVQRFYMVHFFNSGALSESSHKRAIDLTKNIGSDFEHANTLKALVSKQKLKGDELWSQFYDVTRKIGSDFELANLLKVTVRFIPDEKRARNAFFNASETIGSDFEMRQLYEEAVKAKKGDSNFLVKLLKASSKIGSDFEAASLLVFASEYVAQDENVFEAYLDATESVGSDFEMRKVFSKLVEVELEKSELARALEVARDNIGSDFELASLLTLVIDRFEMDQEMTSLLKKAADSIGSDFEKNRVYSAIIEKS